ncbi:hypothetical protein [Rhodoferax sp.]|nr:hypothetical protein [Rhodoferax sp.]MDO9197426.1 hypothetical protein [Rhodoferax sp.]
MNATALSPSSHPPVNSLDHALRQRIVAALAGDAGQGFVLADLSVLLE